MSPELDLLLSRLSPATAANLEVRLRFGLSVCERVEHLLEDPGVLSCLRSFRQLMLNPGQLEKHAELGHAVSALANQHQGSRSLDGVGHAAVSATYACASAMSGKARQAAEYAAYAMVYGQGGYGATKEQEAFVPEFNWLAQQLERHLAQSTVASAA